MPLFKEPTWRRGVSTAQNIRRSFEQTIACCGLSYEINRGRSDDQPRVFFFRSDLEEERSYYKCGDLLTCQRIVRHVRARRVLSVADAQFAHLLHVDVRLSTRTGRGSARRRSAIREVGLRRREEAEAVSIRRSAARRSSIQVHRNPRQRRR